MTRTVFVGVEADSPDGEFSFSGLVGVEVDVATADDGPVLTVLGFTDASGTLSTHDDDTYTEWEPEGIPEWVAERAVDLAMEEVASA